MTASVNNQIRKMSRKKKAFIILLGGTAIGLAGTFIRHHEVPPVELKSGSLALDDKQQALLKLLIDNEAVILADQQESLFSLEDLGISESVKASQLSKAYHQNEIAADNQFRGKRLFVTGQIESIDKDFMDNPILNLRGMQTFMNVMAYMDTRELPNLASMQKGETVTLSCEGNGVVLASARLEDCRDARTDFSERLTKRINSFLAGNAGQDEKSSSLVTMAMYLPEPLGDASSCWRDASSDKCWLEIQQAFKLPTMKLETAAIQKRILNSNLVEYVSQ